MTDLLTTALRELESDAPDPEATREAVYQGIHTRARHRRMATVGAAALTVAALAVGAWSISGVLTTQQTTPGGSKALVPVPTPELSIAVKIPRKFTAGRTKLWNRQGGLTRLTILEQGSPDQHVQDEDFTVGSGQEPPEAAFAMPHDAVTTVQGKPAMMRTYVGEERTELRWELPGGGFAWVESNSASRTRAVANTVDEGTSRGWLPFTVGLMPRHFLLSTASWSSEPDGPTADRLRYCPRGKLGPESRCFVVQEWRGGVENGPEPDASGRCQWNGKEAPPRPTFGRERQVGDAVVRLSSDGCYALKRVEGDRWMSILTPLSPYKRKLVPADFAQMAASIQVRE